MQRTILQTIKSLKYDQYKVLVVFMLVYISVFLAPVLYVINHYILKIGYIYSYYGVIHHLVILVTLPLGYAIGLWLDEKLTILGIPDSLGWSRIVAITISPYLLLITPFTFFMSPDFDIMVLYNTLVYLLTTSGVVVIIAVVENT